MTVIGRIAGWLTFLAAAGLAAWLVLRLPPEQTPWGELALDQPMGPFTTAKIARLRSEPDSCRMLLEESEVRFTPVPDQRFGEGCAFAGVINLERSVTPYSAPVRLTCPATAALYLWERDVVQPAAEFYFGSPVARIEHYGTYSCRRVNHRSTGRFSEHATANAIDVAGFRLENGRTIRVLGNWRGDTPEARFLREVRNGACRTFRTVLSPDYNAAHADHFHLDMGRFNLCR